MLDKAKDEQIPIGVDHALTVLQSMAQAVTLMHEKNVHHIPPPHSVWVGYEGATQILDTRRSHAQRRPKDRSRDRPQGPLRSGAPDRVQCRRGWLGDRRQNP